MPLFILQIYHMALTSFGHRVRQSRESARFLTHLVVKNAKIRNVFWSKATRNGVSKRLFRVNMIHTRVGMH